MRKNLWDKIDEELTLSGFGIEYFHMTPLVQFHIFCKKDGLNREAYQLYFVKKESCLEVGNLKRKRPLKEYSNDKENVREIYRAIEKVGKERKIKSILAEAQYDPDKNQLKRLGYNFKLGRYEIRRGVKNLK